MDYNLQKLELMKMMMEIDSPSLLEEIKIFISKKTQNNAAILIKELLQQSEIEYQNGEVEAFENVIDESKAKYLNK